MIRKHRHREDRGILKNFLDLPIEKQKNFLIIKEIINEELIIKKEIYIFGSYYWGFWDDLSDYDVNLNLNGLNNKKIMNKLKNEYNINVDILPLSFKKGILIP